VPGVSKEQLNDRHRRPGRAHRIAGGRARASTGMPIELPQDIDASSSVAKLENGVLTLTLAKKQPVDTTTRLTIN
jgi:HSP20 family protein